jgi:16S rRNA (guanine527-N7)-methyltransferase
MTLAAELRGALAGMGLDLPDARQAKLLAFIGLLKKWNRTYNLTAIRDEKEMLTHHLLDSLSLLPALGKSALTGDGVGPMSAAVPGCRAYPWRLPAPN